MAYVACGQVLATGDCESIAFPENILRVEVLKDGTAVYSTYNMSGEQTALSYVGVQQEMKGAHA